MIPFLISAVLILINVFIHYECLRGLSMRLGDISSKRLHSILIMLGLTIAHTVEIAVFALAFWFLHLKTGIGVFQGTMGTEFLEHFTFSLTNYATLGINSEASPDKTFRLMSGMEALNGFMMLTWSASFLFRGTGKFWEAKKNTGEKEF